MLPLRLRKRAPSWCNLWKITLVLVVVGVLCCIQIPKSSKVTFYISPGTRLGVASVDIVDEISVDLQTKPVTNYAKYSWFNATCRHRYDYRELNRPRGECRGLEFLAVVTSAVQNVEKRSAIRQTWAKQLETSGAPGRNRVIFILGYRPTLQNIVQREASKYGDILQFAFNDTYRNATLKSVMMLQWAAGCQPTYLVKSDDDTMINVIQLRQKIRRLSSASASFVAGAPLFGQKPIRSASKWVLTKEEYPDETFPDYIAGCLYVMSGNNLTAMYEEALHTCPISIEDVFVTGFLPAKLGIPRFGLTGISTWWFPDACAMHDMAGVHYQTPDSIRMLDRILRFTTRHCTSALGLFSVCRCVPYISGVSW